MSLDDALSDAGLVNRNRSISFVTEEDERLEKVNAAEVAEKERKLFFGDGNDKLTEAMNWRKGEDTDANAAMSAEEQKMMSDSRPLWEKIKEQKDEKQATWERENLAHVPPKALDEEDLEFLDDIDFRKKQEADLRKEKEEAAMTSFKMALVERVKKPEAAVRIAPKEEKPKPAPKRRLLVTRVRPNKVAKTAPDAPAAAPDVTKAPEKEPEPKASGLGLGLGDYGSDSD